MTLIDKLRHRRGSNFPEFSVKNGQAFAYKKALDPIRPMMVEYYEQTKKPEAPAPDLSARDLELTPIQYMSERGMVGQVSPGSDARYLSWNQFRALYVAVASVSGWWPLEDKDFDANEFFGNKEMFMLSHKGKPIGFTCIERSYEGKADHTGIVFVGIIPSEQGKGYGKALFAHVMDKAWQGNTQCVELNTLPELDQMTGSAHSAARPASELYLRAGFELKSRAERTPEEGKLHELNIPQFYENKARILLHFIKPPEGLTIFESRLFDAFGCSVSTGAQR